MSSSLKSREEYQKMARDLVNASFALFRTLLIHYQNNDALKRPLSIFMEMLRSASQFEGVPVDIEMKHSDQVTTVRGVRVLHHTSLTESLPEIEDAMSKSGVESIVFSKDVLDTEVLEFFSNWADHVRNYRVAKYLETKVPSIKLHLLESARLNYRYQMKQKLKNLNFILQNYFLLRESAEEFFKAISSKRVIPQYKLRRSLVTLCEIARVEPYCVVALTLVHEDRKDTTGLSLALTQALRTSLLSLVFSREMGLKPEYQADVAHLGLLYNIGLVGESAAQILKNDKLTSEEYQKVVESQAAGVLKLLQAQGLSRPVMERLVAVYENAHAPKAGAVGLTIDGRILKLISRYVALTSDRPFRDAYTPSEALQILGKQAMTKGSNDLDPILYYLFVRFLGSVPVGTYCELSDGKRAIIFRPFGVEKGVPVVKLIEEDLALSLEEIDLGERKDLQIVKTFDPKREGVNAAGYFFQK